MATSRVTLRALLSRNARPFNLVQPQGSFRIPLRFLNRIALNHEKRTLSAFVIRKTNV